MKISNLLWLSLAVAAPASGNAGLFGLWGSDKKEAKETAPVITNKTIHSMINDERRFVLYNSRKLTGECLEVCVKDPPAADTMEPTPSPSLSPTKDPTPEPTADPTKSPTKYPTADPTKSPTKYPTAEPTAEPTKSPTKSPTEEPIADGSTGCSCEAGDESIGSWKCGPKIYVCPGIEQVCKNTGNNQNAVWYHITQEQCDAMKDIEIGQSCVTLPQYGINDVQGIGLSHRVCYDGTNKPTKNDRDPTKNEGGCSECSGFKTPPFEPVPEPTQPPALDCESLGNLGAGFSEATDYDGCYPPITSLGNANNMPGHDDSVAVFVGGDFIGNAGAELEGKMVTLGDLTVTGGPHNFVSVGLGSQVIPTGGDCMVIGGNLNAQRDVQVFNQNQAWMNCDIVYGGSSANPGLWKTLGAVRHDPNYDLSFYENMQYVFAKKSEYWKTLPSTANVWRDDWETTFFDCTDNDEIQVFNIHPDNYKTITTNPENGKKMSGYVFSNNCLGKTILVNVHGSGDITFNAAAMHWKDNNGNLKKGYGAGGFPTCMTDSMLWNFPDATYVDIGGECCNSEFHGSILAQGNLKLKTSGQSGRTIVLGDLIQDYGGSEFHSYQYNPPIALPDPDDICEIPEGGEAALKSIAYPTMRPTNAPTNAQGPCVRIHRRDLPNNLWHVTNAECAKCHPDQAYKWWPCDADVPRCKGNCVLR